MPIHAESPAPEVGDRTSQSSFGGELDNFRILIAPSRSRHCDRKDFLERQLEALKATALDARKYRILSEHFWTGPMLLDGRLVAHTNSPLFNTFIGIPLEGGAK